VTAQALRDKISKMIPGELELTDLRSCGRAIQGSTNMEKKEMAGTSRHPDQYIKPQKPHFFSGSHVAYTPTVIFIGVVALLMSFSPLPTTLLDKISVELQWAHV
jgi:hypothetical protein